MQHDAGEVQDRHGCCAGDKGDADCMMSGCLSMMPPVAHFASPIHAGSIAIVFQKTQNRDFFSYPHIKMAIFGNFPK